MREITEHKHRLEALAPTIRVGELGPGGAPHLYRIAIREPHRHPDVGEAIAITADGDTAILFQCGGVLENGVNGVTNEALLAIVADRLRCFQAGPYPCKENDRALAHVEWALEQLHARTLEREARGVEGREQT